ncbi:MAG: SDR family oxidoreductase [Roseiflexus sp.]|jgi:3-oxoacyl-[acyl-carrier protein] reductase|uniref:SDR family NAD(P)-dependent oxidoreductase n=1 Tax=Roseiflexus sp. TaxID=2562120 RepID=UPI0025E5FCB5|nr:SDR family oxidoreductase [Roseiflexus sp.]MCL6540720.1 SDR family oxidoreductase [Roseiflexus sp.]
MTTEQQVVLITGARKGIGRFLAERFVRNGALVEGCSREPPDWSLEGYTHHLADVTDEAQVKAMITAIGRHHGRLDIVINNAGVAAMNHSLLTPLASVDRIFNTNVRGVFLVCREAARLMQRRRFGRIVNLSTVAVPLRLEGEALYAASKSAVEMLTRILAREFGPLGITVNAVGPTPIETDLIRGVPAEKIQKIIDSLAIRRLGRFEDVANVIDFFVRPESDYVTGQVIYLGGVS